MLLVLFFLCNLFRLFALFRGVGEEPTAQGDHVELAAARNHRECVAILRLGVRELRNGRYEPVALGRCKAVTLLDVVDYDRLQTIALHELVKLRRLHDRVLLSELHVRVQCDLVHVLGSGLVGEGGHLGEVGCFVNRRLSGLLAVYVYLDERRSERRVRCEEEGPASGGEYYY